MNLLHPDRGALYANMLNTMGGMPPMGTSVPGTSLPQRSPFAIQELLGLGNHSEGTRSPNGLTSSAPTLTSSSFTPTARTLASQASQLLEPFMVGANASMGGVGGMGTMGAGMRGYLGQFNPFSPTHQQMLALDPSLRPEAHSHHHHTGQ